MSHLVVDITGHGFGHAGQVLPLVRALIDRVPGLRVTLRSHLPDAKLAEHLARDFESAPPPPDIGMLMHGPMDIDAPASAEAYRALHGDWPRVVDEAAERLAALEPTLLLADVPYSSLAGARRAGIPAFALSSLNWGGILDAYCGEMLGIAGIVSQIVDAYAGAEAFLQTRPHAAMPELPNARSIGPICRQGSGQPEALRRRLGVGAEVRLALAAFGGIPGRLAMGALPRRDDLLWLRSGASGRDDVIDADALGMPFCDLAASSDVVVTKVGYGTVCETLAAGTRLLFVERPGWPETPAMRAFASANGTAAAITREELAGGAYADALEELLGRPRGQPMTPTGIDEAGALLVPRFNAPESAFER